MTSLQKGEWCESKRYRGLRVNGTRKKRKQNDSCAKKEVTSQIEGERGNRVDNDERKAGRQGQRGRRSKNDNGWKGKRTEQCKDGLSY